MKLALSSLAVAISLSCSSAFAAQELIVKWDSELAPFPTQLQINGKTLTTRLLAPGSKRSKKPVLIKIPDELNLQHVIFELRKNPAILHIEKNQPVKANAQPSNTDTYQQQSHHQAIGSESYWDLATDCDQVTIAILDSGVYLEHEDLKDLIWQNSNEIADNGIDDDNNGYIDDVQGWDFFSNDNHPNDEIGTEPEKNSHGTHVAGLAAASGYNNLGGSGVCWTAQIMPVRILDGNGAGTLANVAAGIDYAVSNGADIVNLSITFNVDESTVEGVSILETIQAAVQEHDTLFIAAAGNEEQNVDQNPIFPAAHNQSVDNIIAVGNASWTQDTGRFDRHSPSAYGVKIVDLSAPGVGIVSTFNDGAYAPKTGTSMSAPIISGAAALLKQQNPDMSSAQLKASLLNSVTVDANLEWESKTGGSLNLATLTDAVNEAKPALFRYDADNKRLSGYALSTTQSVTFYSFARTSDDEITSTNVEFTAPTESGIALIEAAQVPGYFVVTTDSGESQRQLTYDNTPEQISDLAVTSEGVSSIILSWTTNTANSNLVTVERYLKLTEDASGEWEELTEITDGTNQYTDSEIPDSFNDLRYRVKASYQYYDPVAETQKTNEADYSDEITASGEIFAGNWLTEDIAQIPVGYDFVNIRLQTIYDLDDFDDNEISFELENGQLPSNVRLLEDLGHLSGDPTEEGEFTFTIKYTNSVSGSTGAKEFTLDVVDSGQNLLNEPNRDIPMRFNLSGGQFTSLQSKANQDIDEKSIRFTAYNFDKNFENVTISADQTGSANRQVTSLMAKNTANEWITLTESDSNVSLNSGLSWRVFDNSSYDLNSEEELIEAEFAVIWGDENAPSEPDNGSSDSSGGGAWFYLTGLIASMAFWRRRKHQS